LQFDSALNRIDGASEFNKQTVASGTNDVTIELSDFWLDYPCPQLLETVQRTSLIGGHEPRITSYVSGKNCREFALLPLQEPPPAAAAL
jgi:hypothetical protein